MIKLNKFKPFDAEVFEDRVVSNFLIHRITTQARSHKTRFDRTYTFNLKCLGCEEERIIAKPTLLDYIENEFPVCLRCAATNQTLDENKFKCNRNLVGKKFKSFTVNSIILPAIIPNKKLSTLQHCKYKCTCECGKEYTIKHSAFISFLAGNNLALITCNCKTESNGDTY